MNYNPSVVILNLSKAKIKHYKLKILYAGFFNHLLLTVLSFKTIPIILVILRKTIIFAHSDA